MQDIFVWLADIIAEPPYSAVLIILVSMTVTSISSAATRKFADMRRLRRYQAEIKQHQEMQKKARETGNEKLQRKIKRRQPYIDRIQREMFTERCKPGLLFMIPFLLIFTFLRQFYTTIIDGVAVDKVVAIIPFNIHEILPFLVGFAGQPTPAGFGLSFFAFYFLGGLGLGQIVQRVFGTSITP